MLAPPLLLTRLHAPPTRPTWLRRERLLERLSLVEQHKGLLISAPAGYGKTALLAQWIDACQAQGTPLAFAWLSLEEGDNDPVRFWGALVAALQTAFPEHPSGGVFLDMLHSATSPEWQSLLVLLLNEIARLAAPCVLVLDDVQVLGSPAVLSSLGFFLENLPENLHLVLSGRSEPALPLARLRAQGQLIDLRAAELRFLPAETAHFFANCTPLQLLPDQVARLDERAEGWVVGLHLAALSMEGVEDREAFIRSFSGDNRSIVDYLAEEILVRQPKAVQQFLLYTSILERLCAGLCEAVLGPEWAAAAQLPGEDHAAEMNCQTVLEYLERANLFLVPLDQRRVWYRYHRLFADLLRTRLRQSAAATLPVLHRRAAHWLVAHDDAGAAFQHAILAGDLDLAAGILRDQLPALMTRAEVATLASWLAAFPAEAFDVYPELCLGYGWTYLYQIQFDKVERWAQRAAEMLPDVAGNETLLGQVEALRATAAINNRQYLAAMEFGQQALRHLPSSAEWSLVRGLINLNLGDAFCYDPLDFPAAARAYTAALDAALPSGNHMITAVIIGSLGNLHLNQGALLQAEATLAPVLQIEAQTSASGEGLPALGKPLAYLTRLYVEWNRLAEARALADRALDDCVRWNHPYHLMDTYLNQAELCQLEGDLRGCRAAIGQAHAHLARLESARLGEYPASDAENMRHNLRRVDALMRLRAGEFTASTSPTQWEGLPRSLRGAILLQAGRPAEALALAEAMLADVRAAGWLRLRVQGHLLTALAQRQLGHSAAAQQALSQCLDLAGPEGFVRLFLDGGETARSLLLERRALCGSSPADLAQRAYIERLLDAFGLPPAPSGASARLSDRERQILSLLSAGLTNDQIAAELILSTNTIKTHLKRIYEKLGVTNRTEAVYLARKEGWLARG